MLVKACSGLPSFGALLALGPINLSSKLSFQIFVMIIIPVKVPHPALVRARR